MNGSSACIRRFLVIAAALSSFASGAVAAQKSVSIASKSSGPLGVSLDTAGEPLLDASVAVTLKLTAASPLTNIRIILQPDPGLLVVPQDLSLVVSSITTGAAWEHRYDVLLLDAGQQLLRVFVTGASAQGQVARSMVLPLVATSSVPLAAGNDAASAAPIEAIRSMRAIETVR